MQGLDSLMELHATCYCAGLSGERERGVCVHHHGGGARDPGRAASDYVGVQPGKAADPVIMHARARHSARFLSTGIRVKLVTKIQCTR